MPSMREREVPRPWAQVLRWCRWRHCSPEALGGAATSSSWGHLRRVDSAFVVWVIDHRSMVGALKRAHRVLLLPGNRNDVAVPWHLEDIVTMMSHRHELGQGWIPKDGIV